MASNTPASPHKEPSFWARWRSFSDRQQAKADAAHQRLVAYRDQRAGRIPAAQSLSQVVTYASEDAMARGIQHMVADGWQIAGQSSYTPKKGAARMLAGGFIFFNRRPVTVVTFTRATPER